MVLLFNRLLLLFRCKTNQEDHCSLVFELSPNLISELCVCWGRGDQEDMVMVTHSAGVRGEQEAHIRSVDHMELVTCHQRQVP